MHPGCLTLYHNGYAYSIPIPQRKGVVCKMRFLKQMGPTAISYGKLKGLVAWLRERSLFTAGGGRCKTENRVHSKCTPPRNARTTFLPPPCIPRTEISCDFRTAFRWLCTEILPPPPSKGLHCNFAPPLNFLALKFMPPPICTGPPCHK